MVIFVYTSNILSPSIVPILIVFLLLKLASVRYYDDDYDVIGFMAWND